MAEAMAMTMLGNRLVLGYFLSMVTMEWWCAQNSHYTRPKQSFYPLSLSRSLPYIFVINIYLFLYDELNIFFYGY